MVHKYLTGYSVKLEGFEGPLDLLLTLIERRKLHINDISLASVSDDFVAYMNSEGDFPFAESAEFIIIASTLLLIKSKSLIPTLEISREERYSMEELEGRLKQYKRFKELSLHIEERFGRNKIFERAPGKEIVPVFSPDGITKEGLFEAVRRVCAALPKLELIPQAVVRKIIRLEDVITDLVRRVEKSLTMSFSEFARQKEGIGVREARVNVVVSFIAMLELVRRGLLVVTQHDTFRDIQIETRGYGVPRYGE
jgi:segregation and condensation protein A